MSNSNIQQILQTRLKPEAASESANRFYEVVNVDGKEEEFLELQFRNGLRTCFPFNQMGWFNYDPKEGCLDLDFNGILVTIKGRGFFPELFHGIKRRRVSWIKEADSELQDHPGATAFVESITIMLPEQKEGEPA